MNTLQHRKVVRDLAGIYMQRFASRNASPVLHICPEAHSQTLSNAPSICRVCSARCTVDPTRKLEAKAREARFRNLLLICRCVPGRFTTLAETTIASASMSHSRSPSPPWREVRKARSSTEGSIASSTYSIMRGRRPIHRRPNKSLYPNPLTNRAFIVIQIVHSLTVSRWRRRRPAWRTMHIRTQVPTPAPASSRRRRRVHFDQDGP